MTYTRYTNLNIIVPVLGLGTALLNETTYDAAKYALKIGYR